MVLRLLLVLLAGCSIKHVTFHCETDADCETGGRCEEESLTCSNPDATCISGLRHDDSAEPANASACVTCEPTGAIESLGVGVHHTCITTLPGHLYCWGAEQTSNRPGAISRPGRINSVLGWRDVSAGLTHTCGRAGPKHIDCWANGAAGETVMHSFDDVARLDVGDHHACAVDAIGRMACWANDAKGNSRGQAEGGTIAAPKLVTDLGRVTEVAAGNERTCVLTENTVKCIGKPLAGETTQPFTIATNASAGLSARFDHACWLQADSSVACWPATANPPGRVDANRVATGASHTCAALGPQVTCWGSITLSVTLPLGVRELASGDGFSCAFTEGSKLYCWGTNKSGELGAGLVDGAEPVELDLPCL